MTRNPSLPHPNCNLLKIGLTVAGGSGDDTLDNFAYIDILNRREE